MLDQAKDDQQDDNHSDLCQEVLILYANRPFTSVLKLNYSGHGIQEL